MAVCVSLSGSTLVVSPTPIGSCVDYVLYTAADYSALNPLLTPVDAAQLATLVVLVWATAWGIKILRRTL